MFFVVVLIAVSSLILICVAFVTSLIVSNIQVSNITSRTIFITGCDTGFGNLLAKKLDSLGVKVIAGCLTDKGRTELEAATSSRMKTVLIDISKKESVEKAFEFVQGNIGPEGLWGVVNNAGVMPNFAPCEWTPVEEFEAVCKVNLFGTISVSLTFLPLLRQSRGRLVNVCSVTSSCGYPGIANYVVSKSALKMFTVCLRRELLCSGVTTHTIEPGGFRTNVTDKDRLYSLMQRAYKRTTPELQQIYGGNISTYLLNGIKRAGQYTSSKPQKVADAMTHALFAKHPKLRYLVGVDAHTYFRLLNWLPERIVDYMIGWPAPYGELCKEFQ